MEHRWGQRVATQQPVRLVSGELIQEGMLLNASSSGALVVTQGPLKRDQRVCLRLPPPSQVRLNAFVVRLDVRGVAIEWEEFACESVLALLLAKK